VPDTSTPPVPDKTVSNVPPPETQVTETTQTTSTTTPTDTTTDPQTAYAYKARLPDDMRETAQEAADLFKNQKYDESAAKYQTIIDKYPESLYAWSNLGVVRFQQGKFDEALKALQQAVKLSPTDAFSYSNLGIVYYQLNQFENAIDALNAAKALDPNDPKTHNYLGCACSQKGWSEVAEKEFRKAIELDGNFGDAHFNLALVYATQKPPLLELARREYNRALELGIGKDPRLEKLLENTASPSTSTADTQSGPGVQP
jgi:Flp pilus assembly protein TadD